MAARIGYLAWLLARDWAAWRALDPVGLQQSHGAWKRAAEAVEQAQRARGVVLERVVLDPQDFAAWCRGAGVAPDRRARAGYAAQLGAVRHHN